MVVDGESSGTLSVDSGVPQGSVLGLIMIYVDLVSVIMAMCSRMFSTSMNSSSFLVSYCCLIWYCGGLLEASSTDLLVIL